MYIWVLVIFFNTSNSVKVVPVAFTSLSECITMRKTLSDAYINAGADKALYECQIVNVLESDLPR